MENYRKVRTVEQPSACPFPGLPADTPQIRVKDGSKIRNLLRFALSRVEAKAGAEEGKEEEKQQQQEEMEEVEEEASKRPPCKQLVFTGYGKCVSKVITCVEIVKRRVKGLHQLTRLQYCTAVEEWEPLEPEAGLDPLTVSRNLPSIWILLSAEPHEHSQPGYQAPGRYDALWAQAEQRPGQRRKRGGGGGGTGTGGGGSGTGGGSGRRKAPGRQTGRPREQNQGAS